MSPRARASRGHGERLRTEILDATESLLADTGSEDAVSIRSVADAVGVTPPSIYRHFPDKNHLIFEVCVRCFDELAAVIGEAVDDDPMLTFRRQAKAYLLFGVEHPEQYRVMFMGRYELTPEEFADEMLTEASAFGMLNTTVRRLLDSGRVRAPLADVGTVHLSLLLWSAIHGVTSLLVAKPTIPWPPVDELIESLFDLQLRGLLEPDDAGATATDR